MTLLTPQQFMSATDLKSAFSRPAGQILFIAHGVQRLFAGEPTRPHHNPTRVETAERIIRLAKEFKDAGAHVQATALCDNSYKMDSMDDNPVNPELMDIVDRQSWGSDASAYGSYHLTVDLRNLPVHILTGFSASMGVLATALDNKRQEGVTSIVVADAVDNATIIQQGSRWPTKEDALLQMQDAGWHLAKAADVNAAVRRNLIMSPV